MSRKLDTGRFTGTETWWKNPMFPGYSYTDGVRYVAQEAEAYWLIDLIFSHQLDPKARAEDFQVWKLTVAPDNTATAIMTDGNSEEPIIRQDIEYTSFPDPDMMMWLIDKALMLPGEY